MYKCINLCQMRNCCLASVNLFVHFQEKNTIKVTSFWAFFSHPNIKVLYMYNVHVYMHWYLFSTSFHQTLRINYFVYITVFSLLLWLNPKIAYCLCKCLRTKDIPLSKKRYRQYEQTSLIEIIHSWSMICILFIL